MMVVKRIFDVLVSFCGMVFFSPLLLVFCIIIKIEDGGPVFFKQERVGYGGEIFTLYKYRSMVVTAEADGVPHLCEKKDKRLTRTGRFLREHHLDEFPQLWNVLKGDMSIVGYRPERKFFVDKILLADSRYTMLYGMRPGIFSSATLYNGYTDSMDKMLERLRMDLEYMQTWSIWQDIKIVWLTAVSILSGKKF